MSKKPKICVFCGAMDVDSIYSEVAIETGREIAIRGYDLVYGGSNLGLMGKVARSVQENGGKVWGVMPQIFKNVAEGEDRLIITDNVRKRKAIMEELSSAYIALAGGFGTLDEIADVLIHKQTKEHTKPLAIVNTLQFYFSLDKFLETMFNSGFAREEHSQLYRMVRTPTEAMDFIEESLGVTR